MTEFHVEVVRIKDIKRHPNADTLSIATVHDNYPVLFKTGEFREGDLAVYIPVDSVVPDTQDWQWLAPAGAALRERDRHIRAKRLRGIFSMGLLVKAPPGAKEGANVAKLLGITKWEPEASEMAKPRQPIAGPWYRRLWLYLTSPFRPQDASRQVRAPKLKFLPGVYDIEPFRRYGKSWFNEGEVVVVTEKIHGQNASFVHDGKKLHIKSRTRWRKHDGDNVWSQVATKYDLDKKLKDYPGIILFGETYGNNADMPYGVNRAKEGDRFVAFDAFDSNTGKWFSCAEFGQLCRILDIPQVPFLAHLFWGEDSYEFLLPFAEGKTTLGGTHIREGFVIKPAMERQINGGQRVILKMAGESYLTRKGA